MAAYRLVYDSHHLRLTAKNRDQLRNPTLGSRVWATFTFLKISTLLFYFANKMMKQEVLMSLTLTENDILTGKVSRFEASQVAYSNDLLWCRD